MALANPLLNFDQVLFVKRAPPVFPHMSDQYYGWWQRPGGGVWLLEGFKTDAPRVRCLTESFPDGAFLRPDLSADGQRVLFAYARYYPHVAGIDKMDKLALPEDVFFHLYEMRLDGSGVRQLTRGCYDDFDGRYLPDGEIVFLSTRKGQALQCTQATASATLGATLPDSYVRCGGGNTRPVAVYTLHRMNAEGGAAAPDLGLRELRVEPGRGRGRAHPLRPLGLHRPLQWPLREPLVDKPRRHEPAARLRQLHGEAAVRVRGAAGAGFAKNRVHGGGAPFERRRLARASGPHAGDRGRSALGADHAGGLLPRDRRRAGALLREPAAALRRFLSRLLERSAAAAALAIEHQ